MMMDFDCDLLEKHVFASVNVLHYKMYCEMLGGWDEQIEYIEDGEYTSRLLYIYCGKRFPEAVIKYRQHKFQKTKLFKHEHKQRLRKVLSKVRGYKMAGCCGGRRPMKNPKVKTKVTTTPMNAFASKGALVVPGVPGAKEGLVLVKYVGGEGKGKHYYKGVATGFGYKVMFGQFVNVDPADVRSSLFQEVVKERPKPVKSMPKPVALKPVVKPESVKEVERVSVFEDEVEIDENLEGDEEYLDLTEILDKKYQVVLATLDDLAPTQEEAVIILDAEIQGKNRKKVKTYLERRL